jgi:integrase
MQGKRTRALDSRGRPVPGLYVRDRRFIAGFKLDGRWTMRTLEAETLTDARRERDGLLAGLREGRIATPDTATFVEVFAEHQDARSLAERTRVHEQQLVDRHLAELKRRRVQDVTATELARLLHDLRGRYAPWTCVAVYRILRGTFALALRRGIVTRSPIDGLAPSERPKQRNAKQVACARRRDDEDACRGRDDRALAGCARAGRIRGPSRIGELRALRWRDIDLEAGTLTVARSLLRDGTPKSPKTAAGTRTIPLLPALRRLLVAWRLRSPQTRPDDLVIATATGGPVQERDLRRALNAAKTTATVDGGEERLSWHSLRHSFASMLATDLELPATTLARLTGHADAGFTLRVYARDGRDEAAVVEDVLGRAAAAKVAG